MPQADQGISKNRYTVIPRTAIFLRRGDSYLLLKGAPTKRLWANKYNGLGGRIEKGENALTSPGASCSKRPAWLLNCGCAAP